jgi:hypothetical protein
VGHTRDPNELLEVTRDENCGPLSEMILGFASGYFSLARSRIISISLPCAKWLLATLQEGES